MRYLKDLRRELRLRLRQAAVISAGLGIAVGAGLLTTAGPAGAATAAAGHPARHASLGGRLGQPCQVRIPKDGGTITLKRCCPPRLSRAPGRPIAARCCAIAVQAPRPVRTLRPACCPAPRLLLRQRHSGPIRVPCRPVLIPPPGKHCVVTVKPGGPGRAVKPGGPGRQRIPPLPGRCRITVPGS